MLDQWPKQGIGAAAFGHQGNAFASDVAEAVDLATVSGDEVVHLGIERGDRLHVCLSGRIALDHGQVHGATVDIVHVAARAGGFHNLNLQFGIVSLGNLGDRLAKGIVLTAAAARG